MVECFYDEEIDCEFKKLRDTQFCRNCLLSSISKNLYLILKELEYLTDNLPE